MLEPDPRMCLLRNADIYKPALLIKSQWRNWQEMPRRRSFMFYWKILTYTSILFPKSPKANHDYKIDAPWPILVMWIASLETISLNHRNKKAHICFCQKLYQIQFSWRRLVSKEPTPSIRTTWIPKSLTSRTLKAGRSISKLLGTEHWDWLHDKPNID